MKFCSKCDNMYYIGISPDDVNRLTYYCRHCKNIDETITEEGVCVLQTHLKQNGEQNFSHIVDEYTKTDPTLPRIYTMECPNMECPTHKKKDGKDTPKTEIIYVRYDDTNL